MKNLLAILTILLCVVTTSCTKEEDGFSLTEVDAFTECMEHEDDSVIVGTVPPNTTWTIINATDAVMLKIEKADQTIHVNTRVNGDPYPIFMKEGEVLTIKSDMDACVSVTTGVEE